jgi:cobalt-zinc-cadmium efflux system membrane fusion protein
MKTCFFALYRLAGSPVAARILGTSGIVLLAGLSFLLSAGCGRQQAVDAKSAEPPEAKVEKVSDQSAIKIDHPEQFPLFAVEQRPTFDELAVTGVVAPDVNRSVPVLSLAGGRTVEIRAKLGDEVKKDQVLLLINSPDLLQALSDYQKAQPDELLARRQLKRAQLLLSKGAIAQKDLENAEETEEKAKVDLAASAQRVRTLGGDVNKPSPIIEVRAPISGTIVEQNVTSGTGVKSLDNSPNLFTIADLSRVWVLCDVYENNLPQVHAGDLGEVRLTAYPDRKLTGRVVNISRVLDPNTRTAKVRLELDNPGGLMRTGMFATATFRSQTKRLRAVVPSTAVLRLHDKDWVFLADGNGGFRRKEIQAGPVRSDGFQEVLGGLATGDKVVANALQLASAAQME